MTIYLNNKDSYKFKMKELLLKIHANIDQFTQCNFI